MQHKDNLGYLTFAQNSETGNYLEMAYLQALSIKATQRINKYAVIVDSATMDKIEPKHELVFDHIIPMIQDDAAKDAWKLSNEWQAFNLTPFRETVKLDSDILFTTNVDHWWDIMRKKEVCCATTIRDYEGNVSNCMAY